MTCFLDLKKKHKKLQHQTKTQTWPVFISDRGLTKAASVRWSRAFGLYWPAVDGLCRPGLTCSPTHTRTHTLTACRETRHCQRTISCTVRLATEHAHKSPRWQRHRPHCPHSTTHTHMHTPCQKTSSCETIWKDHFWKVTLWHTIQGGQNALLL